MLVMDKFKKVQNIAWTILIFSFTMCLVTAIGTPLGIRWMLRNAMRPLVIVIQPRSGTVSQQDPRSNTSFLVEDDMEILPKSMFKLSDDAAAILLFYQPDDYNVDGSAVPVATVQLYGATDITIDNVQTPRFALSQLSHRIALEVRYSANARISVEDNDDRPTLLYLQTPHGTVDMDQGTYTVVVEEDQTEFSVSSGRAHIFDPSTGDKPVLTELQRAVVTAAGLEEIYIGERDILRNRNGNLDSPLEGTWQVYTDTARQGEDGGIVRQAGLHEARQIVLFERVGEEHAKTGIRQEINQDIRGAISLRVRARVRVDWQTLSVCGSLGTECPLMIRIEFTDQSGSVREWLQGFYAVEGDVDSFCQSCEWKAQHIQVAQLSVWYDYESPDLLPLLQAQGIQPTAIHWVQIYASGHTYGSAIDEIAILIGE